MSKLISLVVLLAAAGFAMAVRGAPQSTPVTDQPAAKATTQTHPSPVKPGDPNCIRDTGSLIPAKQGQCLPVSGRTYSKKDIDNTGESQLGPALEKLDPSITVRGGR
jgi:hypothetical protein